MDYFKSSKRKLFSINPANFEQAALDLFKFQATYNNIYNEYISNLGVNPLKVTTIRQIPFLPIEFFKTHKVACGDWPGEVVFESSGTTAMQKSKHYVEDIHFYHRVCKNIFSLFYKNVSNFLFLALLPSYLERENSSLVSMMNHFIEESNSEHSGFYLHDYDRLIAKFNQLKSNNRPVLLIGVSFALLDLAENYKVDLSNFIVMETGGMKGRGKEITRAELHNKLGTSFNNRNIHSEYGMTELMSQAYAKRAGEFRVPPWMRILLRDLNDPFDLNPVRRSGGINIIDLANIHSCAFIETKDIGAYGKDNTFEVLGRFDNSDIRGCNLMVK